MSNAALAPRRGARRVRQVALVSAVVGAVAGVRAASVAGGAAVGSVAASGSSDFLEAGSLPPTAFTVTDQGGGTLLAAASEGDRLYVGQGPRLVVMGATDPVAPVQLGRTPPLPAQIVDLAVEDAMVYAAAAERILVIDASDPYRPALMGVLEVGERACCERVRVDHGYAYLWGPGSAVTVVDVRHPARPLVVSRLGTVPAVDFDVRDRVAVVAHGRQGGSAEPVGGFTLWDLRDPAAPETLADASYADTVLGVALHRNSVLVTDSGCAVRRVELDATGGTPPGMCLSAGPPNASEHLFASPDDRVHLLATVDGQPGYWTGDIEAESIRWRLGAAVPSALNMAVGEGVAWFPGGPDGLSALRIDELSDVRRKGDLDLAGRAERLTVAGDLALVEAPDGLAIQVVDLAGPDAPRVLSTLEGAGPVAADANRLFQAVPGGVRVLDITDPAAPVQLGTLAIPDEIVGLAVLDYYPADNPRTYLAVTGNVDRPCCASFVQTWDIDDLASAQPVARITGDWSARSAVLHDQHLYVAGGGLVRMVSLVEPTYPHMVASRPGAGVALPALAGDTMIVEEGGSTLKAYDIADPGSPRQLWSVAHLRTTAIAALGDHVWTTHGERGGIRVLDVSDAGGPIDVGAFEPASDFVQIAFHGGTPVVLEAVPDHTGGEHFRLLTLEAQRPGRVSRTQIPAAPPHYARDVADSGDVTVVAAASGLVLLDGGDAGRVLSRLDLTDGGAHAVEAAGARAYVVQQEWDGPEDGARVHAVDITDPFAPRLITTISLADLTVQLDLEGDRLLVTSGRRVRFYDVSDEVPKLYGMLTVADESAGPAALQGHHAYVVDGHTLHVADFGAFGRPRWVGQLQLGVGEPTALAVSGTRALVATSQGPDEGAAIVIDITDPGAPRVAGSITDVGDNITSVTLDGTRAVIATGHAVDLWDVSDRAAPARVARLEAGAGRFFADYQVWAVSVEGDRAWLAAGQAGVVVARLPGAGVRLALPAVHVGRSRE